MSVLASLGDQLPLCEVDLTTTFGTLGNHRGDSLLGRFLYNRGDHTASPCGQEPGEGLLNALPAQFYSERYIFGLFVDCIEILFGIRLLGRKDVHHVVAVTFLILIVVLLDDNAAGLA